jgi:hypothetical protein
MEEAELLQKMENADYNTHMGLTQGNLKRYNTGKKRYRDLEEQLFRLRSRRTVNIPINYTMKNNTNKTRRNTRFSSNNTNTKVSFAPQTVRKNKMPLFPPTPITRRRYN